jgi:hypothetical protein
MDFLLTMLIQEMRGVLEQSAFTLDSATVQAIERQMRFLCCKTIIKLIYNFTKTLLLPQTSMDLAADLVVFSYSSQYNTLLGLDYCPQRHKTTTH